MKPFYLLTGRNPSFATEKAFKIDHWKNSIDDNDYDSSSDFMLTFTQKPQLFLEAIRELENWLAEQKSQGLELEWDVSTVAELELFSIFAYKTKAPTQ